LKIRCLMMFKNEDDLLTPWISYHGALFGFENLTVFDNGSTSSRTVEQIRDFQARGVRIDGTHGGSADFLGKGDLFAATIRHMDATDPADFYLALDCDEFIGVEQDEEVSFRGDDIRDALLPYVGQQHALAIRIAYQNIPGAAGRYRPAFGALTKLFFARGACRTLDRGFHVGTARASGPPVTTPLVQVHYHNKPLPLLQQHARQKLEAGKIDMRPAALAQLRESRGASWHLAEYLRYRDEAEYRAAFVGGFSLALPDFERAFDEIGCELPFSQ
jgi:hypothetical protein